MKRQTFLLASLITLMLTSCFKMALVYHGAHSPRLETVAYINEFAAKKNIPVEGSAMIAEDYILYSWAKRHNKQFLFDANGYAINFNSGFENEKCGGNILSFIEGLDTVSYIARDSNWTLDKESKMWVEFGNKKPYDLNHYINGEKYNYYVVCYWNTYSGNPNHRDAIKNLQKSIGQNPRIKTKIFLVNQDLRDNIDIKKFAEKANKSAGIKVEIKED
jgi:hypothetical protein